LFKRRDSRVPQGVRRIAAGNRGEKGIKGKLRKNWEEIEKNQGN
jgi:hypothetical protein